MKITILELFTIKNLLLEEIKRNNKYSKLIHKEYKQNIKNIYNKVDLEIKKQERVTKTQQEGIKKYTFT